MAKFRGPDSYPDLDAPAPSDTPAVTSDGGEVRTVEQWAEKKGFLPLFIETRAPFTRADAPPMREHNPENWKFAAARAGFAWPIGKELTEAEFDAAVVEATTIHSFR